jgi:hypothetical protein
MLPCVDVTTNFCIMYCMVRTQVAFSVYIIDWLDVRSKLPVPVKRSFAPVAQVAIAETKQTYQHMLPRPCADVDAITHRAPLR